MANVAPFQRQRRRPPRTHFAPHVHAGRSLLSGIGRYIGFFAIAALLAGAALTSGLRHDVGASRSSNSIPSRVIEGIGLTVVDGDSLRAGNEDIRLIGIDAPELRQTCRDEAGRDWPCGRAAKDKRAALVLRGSVACTARERDRYGRTLAACSAHGAPDLGEAMVREGYALNYFQGGYDAAEREARAARRGLWRGDFDRPQDWRRQHPRAS